MYSTTIDNIMNAETKKNLIRFLLQDLFTTEYQESWLDNRALYSGMEEAIERFNERFAGFTALETLNPEQPEFSVFLSIITQAAPLNDHIPPESMACDEAVFDRVAVDEIGLWTQYPNADITFKNTEQPPITADEQLNEIRTKAMQVLLETIHTMLPSYDNHKKGEPQKSIKIYDSRYKKAHSEEERLQHKTIINLLKNIDKLAKLAIIDLPNEAGERSRYCSIAESAGGVTEKISVAAKEDVLQKLLNIVQKGAGLTFEDYKENSGHYDLKTQGIVKLPKHGKTTEVQREAIALNISRILGLTTTQSTMINHKGKAALYVPFDTIQLMQDFAKGEEKTAIIGSTGKKYSHYSTIVPVGNALHGDVNLEDFGAMMAFSYICNDTDFVGAYNQNKAIRDGKNLYVFDQVVMDGEDKMEFDTRLSMVPVGYMRHSRHNQGRNRTLIEDSAFDTKFESVVHFHHHIPKINKMLNHIIHTHQARLRTMQRNIEVLSTAEAPLSHEDKWALSALKQQHTELITLKNDAETIQEKINSRALSMFKNFPNMDAEAITPQCFIENQALIKPALILEKLTNHPVLFKDNGQPYRNPWTDRNKHCITDIAVHDAMSHLTFNTLDSAQLVTILQSSGVDIESYRINGKTLEISSEALAQITENSMFPECTELDMEQDYLSYASLRLMGSSYDKADGQWADKQIERYQLRYLEAESSQEKAQIMFQTLHALQNRQGSTKNIGFLKHIELKLQMDIQQKIRPIIVELTPEELRGAMVISLQQAALSAVKLDRLDDLNEVLMSYAINPVNSNTLRLSQYLEHCIQLGAAATNYNTATLASAEMRATSLERFRDMRDAVEPQMAAILQNSEPLEIDWETDVDPLAEQEALLQEQGLLVTSEWEDLAPSETMGERAIGNDDAPSTAIKVGMGN